MNKPTTRDGKQFKQARVHAELRRRVITGVYAPQSALPTRAQLMAEFGVSIVTIQTAMDSLEKDGFVRSKWGSGTFVSDTPPHLCRYALVFPSRLDGVQGWSNWWTTLRQAAATVARSEPQKQIVTFYDITGHADVEDYQRLLADVQARRLAGLILLTAPHMLLDSPLLEADCPVPRVYIGCDLWKWNMPGITLDLQSFMDRALGHAASRSRRRPMLLCQDVGMDLGWPVWAEACRKHGFEPAQWQMLSLPLSPVVAPRHLTQVLMMLPPERRPDTLVVADDYFVEEVTAGLLASNLPESELPTVISHCNYPNPPRTLLPVTFLGYDSVSIIRAAIDVLDAQRLGEYHSRVDVLALQRLGEVPTGPTIIPAIFESERVATGGARAAAQPSGARTAAAFETVAPHPSYYEAEPR